MQKKAQSVKKPENKVGFEPVGDRVLVRPSSADEKKSAGGFIIPETAHKEKPEIGTVVAVGKGKRNDSGDRVHMELEVGQKVMFSKYGFDEIKIDDEEYYVISESNILGIFTK
jgi:chaperonin GroES